MTSFLKLSTGVIVTYIPNFSNLGDSEKEYWAQWIAALRSGEYPQAYGALRTIDGFCCLGVATDVAVKKGEGHWDGLTFLDDPPLGFDGCYDPENNVIAYLSSRVKNLYGLENHEGFKVNVDLQSLPRPIPELGAYADLTDLNDYALATFDDIAAILEMALAGGFGEFRSP